MKVLGSPAGALAGRSLSLGFALACAAALGACSGCGRSGGSAGTTTGGDGEGDAVTVPASSDPTHADLVEGAVLAAREKAGGVRLLKIVRVVKLPPTLGHEYRMIAYDAFGQDFVEVAKLYKARKYKPVLENMHVRLVDFAPREYRVLAVEPVTEAEKAKVGPS